MNELKDIVYNVVLLIAAFIIVLTAIEIFK